MLHRQHVGDLFFAGKSEEGSSARRRLCQLYEHGYVERIPRFGVPPMNKPGPAYRLAARGAALAAECEGIPFAEFDYWGKTKDSQSRVGQLGHAHLEHNLLLASVRMHFEKEAPKVGAEILTWLDSFDLRPTWKTERARIELNGRQQDAAITPDAYFSLLTSRGRGHFFLELDRGTETISRHWRRKIAAYSAYLQSGKFHQRYGVDALVGFRVLVLTSSAEWAASNAAAAHAGGNPSASAFMMAATSGFLTSSFRSPIWMRCGSDNV